MPTGGQSVRLSGGTGSRRSIVETTRMTHNRPWDVPLMPGLKGKTGEIWFSQTKKPWSGKNGSAMLS